jgi:hypothetical protein
VAAGEKERPTMEGEGGTPVIEEAGIAPEAAVKPSGEATEVVTGKPSAKAAGNGATADAARGSQLPLRSLVQRRLRGPPDTVIG